MTDGIFGKETRSATDILKENMPFLERRVEKCDPDAIRLFRTLAESNCKARANGEIDLSIFSDNRKKIYSASEKFIDQCVCEKFKERFRH